MRNLIYLLILPVLFISCKKDYLQRDLGAALIADSVFSNADYLSNFADNSYNYMIDDFGHLNAPNYVKGTTGQFSDEAVGSSAADFSPFLTAMTKGTFLAPNATDVVDMYERMYEGIRNVNVTLSKIDSVNWSGANYSPDLIRAQMYFLRAFFYFELAKRFGGVVLLDKPLNKDDKIDVPRSSFDSTILFISSDLDKSEQILSTTTFTLGADVIYTPDGWNVNNYGRSTVGAVRALRSKVFLLAASPQHNSSGDLIKWQKAAQAAYDVIKMKKYSLITNGYGTLLNQNQSSVSSPEYILMKVRRNRNLAGFLDDFVIPPSLGGKQAMIYPTQNHVDLYEMKTTGRPIADPASGYNPQNPYANRDPRLDFNVVRNGVTWADRVIEIYEGGKDYQPTSNAFTATGYYCKKLWPAQYKPSVAVPRQLLNFVYFRYADILLAYAEAANEAYGPSVTPYDDTLSAIKAVNIVRSRPSVVMPALQTTNIAGNGYVRPLKDSVRARIHNERAVELAFEEVRWWDLMRWKEVHATVPKIMTGMNIKKTGTTTFEYSVLPLGEIHQRKYTERNNIYPIPSNEIFKSNGALEQNAEWK